MKLILACSICFLISCGSLLVKGDESMQDGMLDEAIAAYEEVLKDKSAPENEKRAAKERIAECYYKKGMKDIDKGNTDAGIANFEKSKNTLAHTKLADIYFAKGIKEYESKKYPEAIDFFTKSAESSTGAKIAKKEGLDEKRADSHFQLGEKEYTANKFDNAKKYFTPVAKEYTRDNYSKIADVLFRLFVISYTENNEDQALTFLRDLRKADPKYVFDAKSNDFFNKVLGKLTRDADAEFRKKNYDGASHIVEKASVLPNFDEFKQKQFKARIVFIQGRDLILEGKMKEGLQKFALAKQVDINIGTEINNFVTNDFIKASKDLQKKKEYQAAVDKLLLARQVAPDHKDLITIVLPDAFYELANFHFSKKDFKPAFLAIKSGLELNKEHKNLKSLSTRFDQTANAVKASTKKEIPPIISYVDEQYRNAVATDLLLGQYKNRKIKWQLKVIGMDDIGGKSYGKFLFDKTVIYGLPAQALDSQRFATGCQEGKNTMEAVLEGSIGYVEELLGIRYIVVNVNAIKFTEPLE